MSTHRQPRTTDASAPVGLEPDIVLDMSPQAVALREAAACDLADDDDDWPEPPPFDVNGFDPAEFEWRPVPRRLRADGWTPEVQRSFVEALADTGMVAAACQAVDMSVQSAYRLRHAPGSESFARAWDVAVSAAADRLIDLAFTRAIAGEEIPYYDRDGVRLGVKFRYNDRLLMHLLRAYRPERFRNTLDSTRQPGASSAPALPPVAQALAALSPVPPAEPHRLMPTDRLAHMVDGARAVAALGPPDERERYERVRIPDSHPGALERQQLRHERERHAEQRAQARAADADGDEWAAFD